MTDTIRASRPCDVVPPRKSDARYSNRQEAVNIKLHAAACRVALRRSGGWWTWSGDELIRAVVASDQDRR